MSDFRVRCYAQVTEHCFDGMLVEDWWDDATYCRGRDGVVCDACYVEVMRHSPSGKALTHEVEPTVRRLRGSVAA